MTQIRRAVKIIAQTCRDWPSADSGWTRHENIDPIYGSEGAGQVVGEAVLEQHYGANALAPGGTSVGELSFAANLPGRYVRLLKADADGDTTTDASGTIPGGPFTPFWWGTIEGATPDPEKGRSGPIQWQCLGLARVLDRIVLTRGREVARYGGGTTADPGYLPSFNKIRSGDRSAATYSVGGATVYVHDRWLSGGAQWTARQILDYLLAEFGRPALPPTFTAVGGLTWQIADTSGALAYVPEELDLGGMTLLEALNRVVNPRRGLTWRLTVSGQTATINVRSTLPAAVSGGSYSVPANNAQTDVDLSASPFTQGVSLSLDHSSVADVIEVIGARPRVTCSIKGTAAGSILKPAWSPEQAADWGDGDYSPDTEDVWHRFMIDAGWTGSQYPHADETIGLRYERSFTTDASLAALIEQHGVGGYTGERTTDASGTPNTPPATTIRPERSLPIPVGYDFESYPLDYFKEDKPEVPPLLFIGTGSLWYAYNGEFRMRIDEEPPAIVIGSHGSPEGDDEDGELLRSLMETDENDIVVTMSFREPHPLLVSWKRDSADWPRDVPRMIAIRVPKAEQWVVRRDTVVRTSSDDSATPGTLVTMVADKVVRDDSDKLLDVLALARAYYERPAVSLSWSDGGSIDTDDTLAPGALLTDATLPDGVYTVGAVITRRSWDFRGVDQATSYETTRILPDIEAIA